MSAMIGNPLLLGPEGYQISRSVRLRSSASAYFNRTPGSAGNRQKWTYSGWVKRGDLGSGGFALLSASNSSTDYLDVRFESNQLRLDIEASGQARSQVQTSALFRDPSAWYHLVVVFDSTNATTANRVLMYVNGVAQTTSNTINQNVSSAINAATSHAVGRRVQGSDHYFDGYLTEINFIDGQALTPSSFGETDAITGVWKPKKYAGTYGTNGFYLNFSDNSSNTATTIGKDYSGNGNNWTPNNISVTAGSTYDSMLDVPTLWADGGNGRGNYCVMNPLSTSQFTVSNANLNWSITSSASNALYLRSTLAMSSGKWYWEVTPTDVGAGPNLFIGIQDANYSPNSSTTDNVTSGFAYKYDGNKVTGATSTAYGSSWTNNDVIGVALDMDAGTITFYKNNTSQGTAFSSLSGTYLPLIMHNVGGTSRTTAGNVNFGQRPFAYTPPTGFKALNTQNLPEPTIKKGASYFDISTWTGDQSARTITNSGGMQPDFLWTKSRSAAEDHRLSDSVRGGNGTVLGTLASNTTGAEAFDTDVTGFTSSGFSIRAGTNSPNVTGRTYVGWQWKEGATQGFDIVTYTGTGANRTVAHSLGVAPAMMIVKRRDSGPSSWTVWHSSFSSIEYIYLNLTNAKSSSSGATVWNSTLPTSSVFSLGTYTDVNASGGNYVAYLFSEVAGFSKFGTYTGNGSADGPFVYTGFRPRWIMIKRTDSSPFSWCVVDTSRSPANTSVNGGMQNLLFPNNSNAEDTGADMCDGLSNGFKLRQGASSFNANGATYIYAAFAENPFKLSLAR